MLAKKVSIAICSYNMANVIQETIENCLAQDYSPLEIIVYDDCSTDNTRDIFKEHYKGHKIVKYLRGNKNAGVGAAFNAAISFCSGDIIITFCADDLWTDRRAISDIIKIFRQDPAIGYVTRWYHQFIHGVDRKPCRAWRGDDPIILANNPSGLAFRKVYLDGCAMSNKMFIESSSLAAQVLAKGVKYRILKWDAVAVRVHGSTSTLPGYWAKRRVSSPVDDWTGIGAKDIAKDYVSFIQIKRGFKVSAVVEEICKFIRHRPINILIPQFWFWAIVALVIPRSWAVALPEFYRLRIGRLITKGIKRG